MKITGVNVFPVNEEKLKAYISITLDDSLVVRNLRIIDGDQGLFVAMPSRKQKNGQFKDIVHPINQEARHQLEQTVFEAYKKEILSIGKTLDTLSQSQSKQKTE